MTLPTIADTFQARLVWTNTNAPRKAVNTLYFRKTGGGGTAASLFTQIAAAVTRNMWNVVSAQAFISEVDITPLDGAGATESFATDGTTKWQGAAGTDAILQGACVVTLRTSLRGKSHRGRIYLPYVAEDSQANGLLTPGSVTAMQGQWDAFKAAMGTASWPMQVVSPKLDNAFNVSSVVVRPNTFTQRRRARR